jgi:hypothetical protein
VDDEEEVAGVESMVLHYYSQRGAGCAALNVGIVKEVARYFFNLNIEMKRIATQDVDESPFTSWKITVLSPCDATSTGRALGQTIPPAAVKFTQDSSTITVAATSTQEPRCPFGYK